MGNKRTWKFQDSANVMLGLLMGILWKEDKDPVIVEGMVLVACVLAFVWTMVWFIVLPVREWWKDRPKRRHRQQRQHSQKLWSRLLCRLNVGVIHVPSGGKAVCGRNLTSAQRLAFRVGDVNCGDCKRLRWGERYPLTGGPKPPR